MAVYLSMCISIIRGDKRRAFLSGVLWAKARGHGRTPFCPRLPSWLGWSGHLPRASCFPPLLALSGQHWPGKPIQEVPLLEPRGGKRKSPSTLAPSCQIQKNQLHDILPLLLSIRRLSWEKKKKFVYIRGLSKPQRILAVNIFLNQITKMYWLPGYSVKCRWPWKSQGHILPFLENKHHKSTPSIYEEGKETPSKASRNTSQK